MSYTGMSLAIDFEEESNVGSFWPLLEWIFFIWFDAVSSALLGCCSSSVLCGYWLCVLNQHCVCVVYM